MIVWLKRQLERRRLSLATCSILFIIASTYSIYLLNTTIAQRSYDVMGHLTYIQWIVNHHALPQSFRCWQCYHPPLYYILAAMVVSPFKYADWPRIIQSFSLLLHVGFLAYAYQSFKIVLQSKKEALLALGLLALWPSVVIHSVRIGNDSLFYLIYSAVIFYLLRAWKNENTRDWITAALLCAIALMTKGNGVILLAIVFLSILIKARKKILMLALIPSMSVLIYQFFSTQKATLIGNIRDLDATLKVPLTVSSFLFDLPRFFSASYIDSRDAKSGNGLFFNYLLQSSLFGEFSFQGKWRIPLVILLKLFLGLLLFVVLWSFYKKLNRPKEPFTALSLLVFVPFGALLAARILEPYSCVGDFRYILPTLIPAIAVFYLHASGFKNRSKWAFYGFAAAFSLCSVIFLTTI